MFIALGMQVPPASVGRGGKGWVFLVLSAVFAKLFHLTVPARIKMAESSDADEFSDDEFYANLPENDFDLVELNKEERRQVDEEIYNAESEESGDELDDDNIPLFYNRPTFEWTGENYKPTNADNRNRPPVFTRRSGPVRIFYVSSVSPTTMWQLFYTDGMLQNLVEYANEYHQLRKEQEPEKNKSDWKELT